MAGGLVGAGSRSAGLCAGSRDHAFGFAVYSIAIRDSAGEFVSIATVSGHSAAARSISVAGDRDYDSVSLGVDAWNFATERFRLFDCPAGFRQINSCLEGVVSQAPFEFEAAADEVGFRRG